MTGGTLDRYERATEDPQGTREQEQYEFNQRMLKLKPTGDAARDRLVAARLQIRRTQEDQ